MIISTRCNHLLMAKRPMLSMHTGFKSDCATFSPRRYDIPCSVIMLNIILLIMATACCLVAIPASAELILKQHCIRSVCSIYIWIWAGASSADSPELPCLPDTRRGQRIPNSIVNSHIRLPYHPWANPYLWQYLQIHRVVSSQRTWLWCLSIS